MSALEWLDAVRADLCRATPGPWDAARPDFRFPAHVITGGPSNTDLVATNVPERDARLIASAPERLDRMEKALRGVMEMPVPDGRHRADLRFVYAAALDDVRATIQEELGDE